MKICLKCEQSKPESEFSKDRNRIGGLFPYCKQCKKNEYYANHEHYKASARERGKKNATRNAINNRNWILKNLERVLLRRKDYNETHKAQHSAYNKQYRQANPDRERERFKEYARTHKESESKRKQEYQQKHPEVKRTSEHKRRASKKGTNFSAEQWNALCAKYEYRCLCCKQVLPLTIDHVIPLSRGGDNSIDNVQPLCSMCNTKKYNKIIDYR